MISFLPLLTARFWVLLQACHFGYVAICHRGVWQTPLDLAWWYVNEYWPYSLAFLVFGSIAAIPWSRRGETDAQQTQDGAERTSLRELLEQLLSADTLILDSNVWMNEGLDMFFRELRRYLSQTGQSIELFGPQLDEICNIKDRATFGTKKSRLARLALNRIETLQAANCLEIQPISLMADQQAYADPLILELIRELTSAGQRVQFVTDDRELRIRAREVSRTMQGKLLVQGIQRLHPPYERLRR